MNSIQFRSKSACLSLDLHGRVKPNTKTAWDLNWLHCVAIAVVANETVSCDWQLRCEDLHRFADRLKVLEVQSGMAVLDTLDGWLDVRILKGADGKAELTASIQKTENELFEFSFSMEAESLFAVTQQLWVALKSFPIIKGQ